MTASATPLPAVRAAFSCLVDYAGLFAPASLPMNEASQAYLAARQGPFAWMLGNFVVAASSLHEIPGGMPASSVVLDAGNDPRAWLDNVQRLLAQVQPHAVAAIEIRLPALATQRETYDAAIGQYAAAVAAAGMAAVPSYVEIPRDKRFAAETASAMYACARYGVGAKIRCGGANEEDVPSPHDVCAFIVAAVQNGVAFKATAGLHQPVRYFDERSGYARHGFVNLLAATAYARQSEDAARVEGVIACQDPAHFGFSERGLSWERERIAVEQIEAARRESFVSYGSCSFTEPVEGLQALGLL